jgi:hypothetical protein
MMRALRAIEFARDATHKDSLSCSLLASPLNHLCLRLSPRLRRNSNQFAMFAISAGEKPQHHGAITGYGGMPG